MNSFVIVLNIFALVFLKNSLAFINGFPKERCDDMDPTKIKLDQNKAAGADDNSENSTDYVSEDKPPPTSIRASESLNLYRIVTSDPKYRRGRDLNITIRGEFSAFMLQVRKIGADERRGVDKPARVGEFVSYPPSIQPVMCDKDEKTAITNKNFSPKSHVSVTWRAPKEDVGDIHIVARFISEEEYWQITESREIPMNEFPVNLKNCGKAKSCILYSEKSASCHEDNCDYILTYSVINSTSVEFVLGGSAKDQNYLAVGFSTTPEGENLKMISCIKGKSSAEIKYFVLNTIEEGPTEAQMQLENKKMDLDGDDRMWCSFVAPMVTHSEEGNSLDLSVPLYQVYLRGNTNYTRGAHYPVLPAKLIASKKEVQIEKIKLQYHTMEKPKSQNSAADIPRTMVLLIVIPLILLVNHKQLTARFL
ncbi:uncharacterized protein [Parasteatoda tepidariorum]|uniref:uncharacterized protein n=1 Tax=Parasteatoda tepidariorum TaxID=114398 RepID=UPI001C727F6F|nr:uncharacterized protein LOC107454814 [Parasteatoda tepidariorum]